MSSDLNERTPGTSSLAEGGLKPEEYPSIDQFNQAWVRQLVDAARLRKEELVGMSDADTLDAMDKQETAYRNAFKKFCEQQGISADVPESERAWQNVRKKAFARYHDRSTDAPKAEAAAPTQPETASPEPAAVIPESMRIERWADEWGATSLTPESLARFNAAFIPELGKALAELSKNSRERAAQLHAIEGVYTQITYRMYENANPGADKNSLWQAFQKEAKGRWRTVLNATGPFVPRSETF